MSNGVHAVAMGQRMKQLSDIKSDALHKRCLSKQMTWLYFRTAASLKIEETHSDVKLCLLLLCNI